MEASQIQTVLWHQFSSHNLLNWLIKKCFITIHSGIFVVTYTSEN